MDYTIEQLSNVNDKENNITFTYSLSRSGLNSPKMTITLSKENKKILSKHSIYKTEEDYIRVCNNQTTFFSIGIGFMCAIVIMAVYTIYSNIQMSKSKD